MKFSHYNRVTDNTPDSSITLDEYVELIRSDTLRDEILAIRAIEDKKQRSERKVASLPACTVQCRMEDRSKGGDPQYVWTGHYQGDCDGVSLEDAPALRDQLAEMAHCHCAHLSPSGKVKAIFMYALPEGGGSEGYHRVIAQTLAAEILEETGQQADRINDGKRMCFMSHDPDIKVNPFAVPHDLVDYVDRDEEEEDEWDWADQTEEKKAEAVVLLRRIAENGPACVGTFHEPEIIGKILPNVCATYADEAQAIHVAELIWQHAETYETYKDLIPDKVARCREKKPKLSVGTLVDVLKAAELSLSVVDTVKKGNELADQFGEGAPEKPENSALYNDKRNKYYWPTPTGFMEMVETKARKRIIELIAPQYPLTGLAGKELKIMQARREAHTTRCLREAEDYRRPAYAGEIAGRRRGMFRAGDQLFLIKNGWAVGECKKGSIDTTWKFLVQMLNGEIPAMSFLSWLQRCLQDLVNQEFRHKWVPIFVGAPGIGKSTVQELITQVLNGGSMDVAGWMFGSNVFHDGMESVTHLFCDDPALGKWATPGQFDDRMKNMCTYEEHRVEPKGIKATALRVLWAFSMSLNNVPRYMDMLPGYTDGAIDKAALFKCVGADNLGGNGKWPEVLRAELPALRYYLLNEHKTLDDWKDNRYGVKPWQDPELVLEQKSRSDEALLIRMLSRLNVVISDMKAAKLLSLCQKDPKIHDRLQSVNSFGKSLGRIEKDKELQEQLGITVTKRKTMGDNVWTIQGVGFPEAF